MFIATLVFALVFPPSITEEWPHIRGPQLDGRSEGQGLFEGEDVGFIPRWTAPLGSSYAGVVIGRGHVVTAFSDGEEDILIALDEENGKEVWRHSLGPTYRGHDGSDDGVIATPVIGDGTVFAFAPHGKLLALDLRDGSPQWSIDVQDKFGAPLPEHGFGSTPLFEDGRLIVQVGGPKSLCAFDAKTGELEWSSGTNDVWYQSPLAMDLAGRRQLVVLDQEQVKGLDPEDGTELWALPTGQAQTGIATPVDETRFFAFVGGRLAMFQVEAKGDTFEAEILFASGELGGRSYATPVYHDGHLYGFRGDFLTCIDAQTGRRKWKSRPPGGRGLIGIEDRLIVFGSEGAAVMVKATPEGYQEEDRLYALKSTGYSWPSFASNSLYIRNLDAMARVDIGDRAKVEIDVSTMVAQQDESRAEDLAAYERFEEHVDTAGLDIESLQPFLDKQARLPLVDDQYVHLVFEGDVEDVAVSFSGGDTGKQHAMKKLGESNFYYKGFAIKPGQRYEYRFQVNHGTWQHDLLNPNTSPALRGGRPDNPALTSVVMTEGFEASTPFLPADCDHPGKIDDYRYASKMLNNQRAVRVYTPYGYEQGDESYPLLIVHEGRDWLSKGLMKQSLDNLIGNTVQPVIVAFVDQLPRWWLESGGTGTDAYLDMLTTEFLTFLKDQGYRISEEPFERALLGTRGFGLTSAYAALRHPDVFGKAAAMSVSLGDVTQYAFFDLVKQNAAPETSFYVDWNAFEDRKIDRGFDKREDSLRLFSALEEQGYDLVGGESPDSFGWGAWRSRIGQVLESLFPIE